MSAAASMRFRTSTPELSEFAQLLAETAIRREDVFTPPQLVTIALALAMRGSREGRVVHFVRTEALKAMQDFEPANCAMLLEAFRRWGIFDRELVDMVVERMCDEIDRFTSRNIVECLGVVSRIGLARGYLLRELCTSAFDNLHQFRPRELASMSYSLAKLRFLAPGDVTELVMAIQPGLPQLSNRMLSDVLFMLAMTDAQEHLDFAKLLVEQYVDGPNAGGFKGNMSLVDFAWSLVALNLVDQYKPEFKAVMERILKEAPPQNRTLLVKLFDVFNSLDLEHKRLRVNIAKVWKAACNDAAQMDIDRLETSPLHAEILMRFDSLHGKANGQRWRLKMQQNQQVGPGPYMCDLVAEESKIVLDVDIISSPMSARVKQRIVRSQGYKTLLLSYWDWRRLRTEEEQCNFLEESVTAILEERPALTSH
eukprot:NODE_7348_length_1587_cov_15.534932.p1 GENE.NODE_7348_length_1587_cov_15.534932~~NODE_7348_length_1587_cov_15.534932.p1  ORF type:complete len:480 (-),score=149.76 NODE_7348_length_1587_cov_15.534932:147-1418(-)